MARRPSPSDGPGRLAERLAVEQRRRFWGRDAELSLFRSGLLGDGAVFSVLYVHGLGGAGKSALLRQFETIATEQTVRAVYVDGRLTDPSPGAFLLALRDACGLDASASPLDHLRGHDRLVLMIDSYELLTPIDVWLRDTFLPKLTANVIVVIAGRQPPPSEWTTDLGWGPLVRVLPLRNLRPDESRALLEERRVPESQQDAVLEFTHGHPLALVLVADVIATDGSDVAFSPERAPNVVHSLMERIVAGAPSPLHRKALELCARARVTTEALLGATIAGGDAHELFEWLRGLSFIEQGPEGLFPHDVAREAIDADFRWRDREGYRELHRRLMAHVRDRLCTASGRAQQQAFFDKLYLHRSNPIGAQYHDYGTLGTIYAEAATSADHASIVETVRRYEGPESAEVAAHWLRRQPQAFQIIRGVGREPIGFAATLSLHDLSADHVNADPAVRAALDFARRHGPVRPGEEILHHRFHMACDVYQGVSPAINLLAAAVTVWPARRPRLAWSFITFGETDPWRPIMKYINFQLAQDAAFTVGGHRYTVFAHDWRIETFDAWWAREVEYALGFEVESEAAGAAQAAPLVVLSEPEFGASVRRALRDYTHPESLAANPLLRSRVVRETAPHEATTANLQALLRDAVERLKESERDEKFYRALWHTFIQPAASQERCAERLGLPFSTYRYHLARGIDHVVSWLWQRELHGMDVPVREVRSGARATPPPSPPAP